MATFTVLSSTAQGSYSLAISTAPAELTTKITPKLESEMEYVIITEPTESPTVPSETSKEPTTDKAETTKRNDEPQKSKPNVKSDANNNKNADDITTLSGFKNTGLPISELKTPSDLKLDENGIPTEFKYAVYGKATAYHGDPATATGRKPMPGHIAVDPKEFPYGSELYIVSADGSYVYGYSIAADTGGFVKMGNTDIDLYLDNTDMCYDWGNRNVVIYVL